MKQSAVVFTLLFFCLIVQLNLAAQTCGTRQLDPRIAAFLQLIGNRDFTIEQIRQIPIEQIKNDGPPYVDYPQGDVQRIKVTADSIPVLVFNPAHAKNLPIIINYHGGGFIQPLLPSIERGYWQDAQTFGAVVFAVDYRVAPDYKFPVAVNDSYNAFKWVVEHGSALGGDTNRIVLMGASAGANLAAVICQKAKKEGITKKIKLQVLNGLPADISPKNLETAASYQENAKGFMQTKAAAYFSIENYAPGETWKNPEVSPILSDDFSGLPPAVVVTAEFDPLRDDGFAYTAKLRKFGVKVWDKCFAGQIHCLIGLPADSDEMKAYNNLILAAMKECLGK